MKFLLNIIFLSLPIITFSQPGGGGGISIKYFYDQNGNEIDLENNKDYQLTCILILDTLLATKNTCSKIENPFQNLQVDSIGYVPHYRDTSEMVRTRFIVNYKYKAVKLMPINSFQYGGKPPYDNFRIILSTQKDTMVIDFVKVIGGNPSGIKNRIDSLTFNPVYFQYKRKNAHSIAEPWTITQKNLNAYAPLITDQKKFLKECELARIDEEINKLEDKMVAMRETEAWKMYDDDTDIQNVYRTMVDHMHSLKAYRKEINSEIKSNLRIKK